LSSDTHVVVVAIIIIIIIIIFTCAPATLSEAGIVFLLPVCLFVCLSLCVFVRTKKLGKLLMRNDVTWQAYVLWRTPKVFRVRCDIDLGL